MLTGTELGRLLSEEVKVRGCPRHRLLDGVSGGLEDSPGTGALSPPRALLENALDERPGGSRPAAGLLPEKRKEAAMKPFRRILVATDFTPASEPALEEAIGLAKGDGTELLIAHAYQLPNVPEAESVAGDVYDEWVQSLRDSVVERLKPLVEKARSEGIRAEALILTGAPYEAITQAAEEQGADLVIMGTHGRKGVSRLFLGSVASRVISTAP